MRGEGEQLVMDSGVQHPRVKGRVTLREGIRQEMLEETDWRRRKSHFSSLRHRVEN